MNAAKVCRPPEWASAAERMVWHLDESDGNDRRFRHEIFQQWPSSIAYAVAKSYVPLYETQGRRRANLFLHHMQEKLNPPKMSLAWDDSDLVKEAERANKYCRESIEQFPLPVALRMILSTCNRYGMDAALTVTDTVTGNEPRIRIGNATYTVTGFVRRTAAQDPRWWRRRLRTLHGKAVESAAIEVNLVNSHAGIYASDETLERKRQQTSRNRRILEAMQAVNDSGDCFSLAELADVTVSNPRIRRAELMTRVRGFEDTAKSLGHAAEFYTLTCPSRMHSAYAKTGTPNPKYDGTKPEEAQEHLRQVWARIRSAAWRAGLEFYGFRVAEPQHDGTPHWHFLLFMPACHTEAVRELMKRYALQTDGDEPGAEEHRFTAVAIDWSRGSAAGYIAKYISKNIDGFGLDAGLYGEDPVEGAQRVKAWASAWSIRQFQQIGGPPVSVWREFRRLKGTGPKGSVADLSAAADQGDWQAFVKMMGGPLAGRWDHTVKVARIWSDQPGVYGEPLGWQVRGLAFGSVFVPTRFQQWRVERQAIEMPPLVTPANTDLEISAEPGSCAPWTCVNNCTTAREID